MIDALTAVTSVYVLHELRIRLQKGLRKTPSAWHWEDRIQVLIEEIDHTYWDLVHPFARAFRDYIALSCAAEARHGKERADRYWEDWPATGDRSYAWCEARQYDPQGIVRHAEALFAGASWQQGFGGESWARIARAGQLYGRVPDDVFLDHVVDLSHNNGLYLDKGIIFFLPTVARYLQVLDRKQNGSLLTSDRALFLYKSLRGIVEECLRFRELVPSFQTVFFPDDTFEPEVWLYKPFKPKLVESRAPQEEEYEHYWENEEQQEEKYALELAEPERAA